MRQSRYGSMGSMGSMANGNFDDAKATQDDRIAGAVPESALSISVVLAIAAVTLAGALLVNHFPGDQDTVPSSGLLKSAAPILAKSSQPHHHRGSDDSNVARFYDKQLVDHFRDQDEADGGEYWSNRYYQSTKYFAGPGHPIFLIIGGEDATDDGMFYPLVTEHLAKRFQAAVIQVEHRFYGPYAPIQNATTQQLLRLLTPHQAMSDMVRLVGHVRDAELGCSPSRSKHQTYCPVIAVGGSYPGFLSALFRLLYPDFVDISYAASAPLLMYAQKVDQNVYYDIVTDAAERSSPGCAAAVKRTLLDVSHAMESAANLLDAANAMGVCVESVPAYMTDQEMFKEALIQITSFKFADDNMDNYPPGPHTGLYKTCQHFQQPEKKPSLLRMKDFLFSLDDSASANATCFDMMTQLPKGAGATLEDTDGDYNDGMYWDFQTCTNVIFLLGFSERSMFPPHEATYKHMTEHCRQRFGVTPRPRELAEAWGFDDLSQASNIIFTNGLQDMWSGGSYLANVSDTVIAINFENGAHHSDLSHLGPSDADTEDIKQGFVQIEETLAKWLDQLKRGK